jgi:hypothetical protein
MEAKSKSVKIPALYLVHNFAEGIVSAFEVNSIGTALFFAHSAKCALHNFAAHVSDSALSL